MFPLLVEVVSYLFKGAKPDLSGAGFQAMALFGKSKRVWLQTFLALPHGIPVWSNNMNAPILNKLQAIHGSLLALHSPLL